jgi:DNA-binding MarR family transcriptional regulator
MMVSTETEIRIDELAQSLFEVLTHLNLAAGRGRRRPGDLKEVEFLTLVILHGQPSMIVGDIQRLLGVLPAQMSRIIRALEDRERPLIACRINPQDKRKIDVCLTPAGEKAMRDYETPRIQGIMEVLRRLGEEDQEDVARVFEKLRPLADPDDMGPATNE